jgi:uncharacterized protein
MSTLLGGIFLASLLGSPHCGGMCGPFVTIAVGGKQQHRRTTLATLSAFHAGRSLTYATLGAVAGGLASAVDISAQLAGLSPIATSAAGVMLMVMGLVALLKHGGIVRGGCVKPPAWLAPRIAAAHRKLARLSPATRALGIGLLTTMLPCGWLWAFVLVAAASASALSGVLIMVVFWAGTLPVLTGVALGARALLGPLQRHAPRLASVALIAAGVWTLAQRGRLDPARIYAVQASPDLNDTPACCRENP